MQEIEAPPVEAVQARVGSLPLEERLNGVVRADNQVTVRPEVPGRVVEVLVRSGDAVEKNQPLVRLDASSLREGLRQREADLRLAEASAAESKARVAEMEAEVRRTRKLAAEDLVSPLELETLEARLEALLAVADQAEARVSQAEAGVVEGRLDLDRTVVRAPTEGRLGRRGVEVGTMVDPGTPLFVLGDLKDLVVEVPLTETMLSFIREGQTVRILPRSGGASETQATLSRISPFLDPDSFTTIGEIDLDDASAGLRPGMFVTVDIFYGETEQATLVPTSVLWEDPQSGRQGAFVFTEALPEDLEAFDPQSEQPVDPSEEAYSLEFREVDVVAVGRSTLGLEGLDPDDWVVAVGQHLLAGSKSPRARVRVVPWQRVMELQGLQREDLLADFLDRQQRLARERGAKPPSNEEFLQASPTTGNVGDTSGL